MGSSRRLFVAQGRAPVACLQRERFRKRAQDGFIRSTAIARWTSATSSDNGFQPDAVPSTIRENAERLTG
jgi:hypothetical protein